MTVARNTASIVQDARTRCPWVDLGKADYVAYHDEEWGVPVRDDHLMFEYLSLEGAQAGLSWYTVLRKREAYRKAFANFDIARVARFDADEIAALMIDDGLIRHRQKIESTVSNARAVLRIQEEFGSLCSFMWSFAEPTLHSNAPRARADYRVTSSHSDRLSAELKRRGCKFVGSTTMYALMQATGIVNDHAFDCFRQPELCR